MRRFRLLFLPSLASVTLSLSTPAKADTVQSTAVVYAAGMQSGLASAAGGTVPTAIDLTTGTSYLTFSVSGSVTLNVGSGSNVNDPDGTGAAVASSWNSGYGSISGLQAPGAGYLSGVFVGAGGPSGSAPAFQTYATTDFKSLSPELDQAFFIGDGLTGDGTGSVQSFYVPNGATRLYLGISDVCGYYGGSSCYGDNAGSYSVDATQVAGNAVTPEPSSFLLLGTGVLSYFGMARRKYQV